MSKYREQEDIELFNTISEMYAEKDIYPVSKMARAFQIECMIEFVSNEFKINHAKKIIEVGCGHGANSEYFEEFYDDYLGVDYSEELVRIASERYGNSKTKFVVDNIKKMDEYGSFDIVIGIGILHHVDNIKEVLLKLKEIGHDNTLYLFYEPQRGNPFIQLLRKIRMNIDDSFSSDQVFFEKQELTDIVENLGFKNIKTRFNGYFTPPFAQVILKPVTIFTPLVNISIILDKLLFRKMNSRLAWNFMIAFTK